MGASLFIHVNYGIWGGLYISETKLHWCLKSVRPTIDRNWEGGGGAFISRGGRGGLIWQICSWICWGYHYACMFLFLGWWYLRCLDLTCRRVGVSVTMVTTVFIFVASHISMVLRPVWDLFIISMGWSFLGCGWGKGGCYICTVVLYLGGQSVDVPCKGSTPLKTHFRQKDLHCNISEPVPRDHLPWETTFLWPMGWSFKTDSTIYSKKNCNFWMVFANKSCNVLMRG